MPPVLIGNSFPLSLIRRAVHIEPRSLEELQQAVGERGCLSYWGHANTLEATRKLLGFDPTPTVCRPALTLSSNLLPCLDGVEFAEVWVLSPDYAEGFRPQIAVEVAQERIIGWQVLRIAFRSKHL